MRYSSRFHWLPALLALYLLYSGACSPFPYAKTNREHRKQVKRLARQLMSYPPSSGPDHVDRWVGTVNFNLRKPNFVIIHHTAQNSCDQTLKTFTLKRTQVSAHYVICKDGRVHHMLNDYLRAWHGGRAQWGPITDINSVSIGIELDNNGFEPFPDSQLQSLYRLLDTLKARHAIPAANFIGHGDIAPRRKNDPNVYFPWQEMADKGFGLWYPDTTGVKVPDHFDSWQALKIVGYSLQDTSATIRAFKQHFLQTSRDTVLTEPDRKVLYQLYPRYLR